MSIAVAVRARTGVLYYAAHAAVTAALLAVMQYLRHAPLEIPWHVGYSGDGLFFTAYLKMLVEDGPWHARAIGAPFGADIVDWPLGMWLPLGVMYLLAAIVKTPGAAINLFWMLTVVVSGVGAAYAFRRLRVSPGLAFVGGTLYSLLPYTHYRSILHINLVYPFVPLLCLLCLRLAGARPEDETRGERATLWAVCVLQGLSYVYYTFFACMLIGPAMLLGAARRRTWAPVRRGTLAILLLCAATGVTLVPYFLYVRTHGVNHDMGYKLPLEADGYGLKLRHLLTPVPNHPIPLLAAAEAKIMGAQFPGDNENTTARLGTFGGLGLIALLVFMVGRCAGLWREDEDLGTPGAMTLVALLMSTVGGLGSFFNLFVAAEIRAYNRIVVFIAFFAILAAALVATRLADRLALGRRLSPFVRVVLLGLMLLAGIRDQMPYDIRASTPEDVVADYAHDRAYVGSLEAQLPPGAMIFQLPHSGIPFGPYEPARLFLHSHTLRWSWGAVSGRNHAWPEMVGRLPPAEVVRWATAAGFAGLMVDRSFYRRGKPNWPSYEEVERSIAALPVGPMQVSPNGRYSFFPLEPYAHELERAMGAVPYARLQERAIRDVPAFRWGSGCTATEQLDSEGWWRGCGRAARIVVRNSQGNSMRMEVVGRFRSGDGAPRSLVITADGGKTTLALGAEPVLWREVVEVSGWMKSPVELAVDGGPPCAAEPPSPCVSALFTATPLDATGVASSSAAPSDEPAATGAAPL
jgi:phosphoglycerol transferase